MRGERRAPDWTAPDIVVFDREGSNRGSIQWSRVGEQSSSTFGALLVHYNLQMRPSQCNWEQVKLLKRRENRRAQTGQVGLANRRLQVCMQEALRFAPSLNSSTGTEWHTLHRTASLCFGSMKWSRNQSRNANSSEIALRIALSASDSSLLHPTPT